MHKSRDFSARPQDEQDWMLKNTWCNKCQEADIGMTLPVEYEEEGSIFVEGKCLRCGSKVINRVDEKL